MDYQMNSTHACSDLVQSFSGTGEMAVRMNNNPFHSFNPSMPFWGSNGFTIGTHPNPLYFMHPETNYFEHGEVQSYIYESCSIKVKDLTGSIFVVQATSAFIVGKWRQGMEVYHIHPLGSVEKCFIEEDTKGTYSTIKISKDTFVKTVKPEQLKLSNYQMQQLVTLGDAGKCLMVYSL